MLKLWNIENLDQKICWMLQQMWSGKAAENTELGFCSKMGLRTLPVSTPHKRAVSIWLDVCLHRQQSLLAGLLKIPGRLLFPISFNLKLLKKKKKKKKLLESVNLAGSSNKMALCNGGKYFAGHLLSLPISLFLPLKPFLWEKIVLFHVLCSERLRHKNTE